jgi:DNA-binding transcriptional LysR family regulator
VTVHVGTMADSADNDPPGRRRTLRLVDTFPVHSDRRATKSASVSYFTPAKLEALVAVAEEGGLSAAARRLHLSQPALSQTISGLEHHLGIKLFTRTSTGVRTTRAGRAVLNEARAILDRHDRLLQSAAGYVAADGGTLRLAMPYELPPQVLNALTKFGSDHPETPIQLHRLPSADQLARLRSGALDVGFMHELAGGQAFDAALVGEDQLGVLLSSDVAGRLTDSQSVRLDALVGLDWIGFPRSSSPTWHDRVAAVLRSHGIDPGDDANDKGESPSVIYTAVSSGRAFAVVPEPWSHPIPDAVVWIRIADDSVVRPTWAVWHPNCRRHDVARLIDALEQPLQKLQEKSQEKP